LAIFLSSDTVPNQRAQAGLCCQICGVFLTNGAKIRQGQMLFCSFFPDVAVSPLFPWRILPSASHIHPAIGRRRAVPVTTKFQVKESSMKFSRIAVLLAGSFAFANAISAQALFTVSQEEAPILAGAETVGSPPSLFPQAQPEPPSAYVLQQTDVADSHAMEDRYRAEVKLLAQKDHQFVHCKLKNGKVLTGRLSSPGDKKFAVYTNALGDGTSVEYKDIAEPPRAVPAVGTRIKQGAQLTGFVIFVVMFFIPLALTGVIPSC
jgi:hypothetical protein